jgi:hypothetical protein
MKYDYNKGRARLQGFVSVALERAYISLLEKKTARFRMPRTVYFDVDKQEWLESKHVPVSLSDTVDCIASEVQLDPIEEQDKEELTRIFSMKILNAIESRGKSSVSSRGRLVYKCVCNPSGDFLTMLRNKGADRATIPLIAQYIGCDNNVVNFELYKIKAIFTQLAKSDEFIDLYGVLVAGKGWPMIHISGNTTEQDQWFVRQTIENRRLDPKPLSNYDTHKDHIQKSGDDWRMIERYSWGMVLVLKHAEEYRTLVIEGKLNVLSGEVFGSIGQYEPIPISWYPALAQKLNGVR